MIFNIIAETVNKISLAQTTFSFSIIFQILLILIPTLIAFWGVFTHRALTRRTNTLRHLNEVEADRDIINARDIFIRTSIQGSMEQWAEENNESSEQTAAIRLILSDFELISIAIQFGTMDFEFYKQYHHGTVKRYWIKAAPFITALRIRLQSDTLYQEFETLYNWVNDNQKPKRSIWKKLWI